MHNTSGKDVTIFDYQDPPKPYAQLLADGTVQVNTNSEAYYLNEDRLGQTTVPTNLGAEPKWKQLSTQLALRVARPPHRTGWASATRPASRTRTSSPRSTTGPCRSQVAGQKGTIAGTLTWVPLDEGGAAARRDLRLRRAADRALARASSSSAAAATRR